MSQPLTLEHFDDTMRSIADVLADQSTQLTAITDTLKDHTRRLDRLEKLLDLEQRLERFETDVRTKFRKVGEHLAIPEITV